MPFRPMHKKDPVAETGARQYPPIVGKALRWCLRVGMVGAGAMFVLLGASSLLGGADGLLATAYASGQVLWGLTLAALAMPFGWWLWTFRAVIVGGAYALWPLWALLRARSER